MENLGLLRWLVACLLTGLAPAVFAGDADDAALARSIAELQDATGRWEVVTEFLNPDGTVARSVQGTYEFSWVVPDRVVAGKTQIPELQQTAGILFYINEAQREIEMVSVGRDGRLWIMTGPLGGTQRFSQEYQTAEGETRQLRFTRYNVSRRSFESKMDYTDDGGKTWTPGNHQVFNRIEASATQ